MRRSLLAATLLATIALAAPASAQQPGGEAWPAATLPLTETQVIRSAVNGREYHIAVALPMRYHAAGADTTRYPVLYVLDGGAHLPMLASMFRFSNRGGRSGDVIMVGIGYYAPGTFTAPPPGQTSQRNIDYPPAPYPTADASDTSAAIRRADAAGFLRALREEIIPLIERRYRTSGERALEGHSLGGLFATYALLEDPDLFDRYAIMSAFYQWDGGSMFEREARFRASRQGLDKDVFFAVGGREGAAFIGGMWRMVAALCDGRAAGNYRGLRIRAEVVPDEPHNSGVLLGRALSALYPPPDIQPDSEDVCAFR